jgi:hypothetical protein
LGTIHIGLGRAATIDLEHGAELTVDFGLPGYSASDPGARFPATIGLELAVEAPSGSGVAPIPGSSQSYYSGILIQASLESMDGRFVLPLFDADSWRLGLATGNLVGDAAGNGTAILSAQVAVSLNTSEAIFGTSGEAQFAIQNLGDALVIGLGPGYSLSNAILAPLTSANGSVETAGYLQSMQLAPEPASGTSSVPEPAAFVVAAAGGAFVFWLRSRIRT